MEIELGKRSERRPISRNCQPNLDAETWTNAQIHGSYTGWAKIKQATLKCDHLESFHRFQSKFVAFSFDYPCGFVSKNKLNCTSRSEDTPISLNPVKNIVNSWYNAKFCKQTSINAFSPSSLMLSFSFKFSIPRFIIFQMRGQ